MNKRVVGALALLVLGLMVVIVIRFAQPYLHDIRQRQTSDARATKGRITIAMDNWVGYVPLCSAAMKKRLRTAGWRLQCQDDKADYALRMRRLREREIDFAVATVDSYLLNGSPQGFPGVIIAVIDESKGGDAIVARKDTVASLGALKGHADLKVAFTPHSPSHFLAKATADHFNVPELLPSAERRIETQGSEEALARLLAGKADVAVLWEPDVSRALSQNGIIKLLGTEHTQHLIVDILLVNRKFSEDHPEVVKLLLSSYFKVLKIYRDKPETLRKEVADATHLPQDAVDSMLKGVLWVNLTDNCQGWFGISSPGRSADEGLVDTIESTVRILEHSGDFSGNPIPDNDPYRLIQSRYLEDLFVKGIDGFTTPGTQNARVKNSLEALFPPLDADGWNALRAIGRLKIDPIIFQSGSAALNLLEKRKLDEAIEKLKHYPKFRVVLKGHTGLRGDPVLNTQLSQQRAESVRRYFMITYAIDPNRLRAVGMGSKKPLPRKPGESRRAYNVRLSRVEFLIVTEVY
jgi:outer membrane protein OmpA-like peptidoglycan-associated protein/ABC-type nitrate/sulfonate/bicarbonate transport system substrate-binding protein